MARWSGAKARCGYYSKNYSDVVSGSNGYNPIKGVPPKSWPTITGALGFIVFTYVGIGLMPLIALPVLFIILIIYLLNNCKVFFSVKKLNKNFKLSAQSIEHTGTNLTLHKKSFYAVASRDGWYVLDAANSIIERLNEHHDSGFSDWRVPTYSEMDSIFNEAERQCVEIYSKTNRSYSVSEIFKKTGMNDIKQENYICKGFSSGEVGFTPYFKDMHFGCRSDSLSTGPVYLLPVRDGRLNKML